MITLRMSPPRRRQQIIRGSGGSSRQASARLGEAVGEVAAVGCCFPCGLANFVFLAIYKLPASFCRRVLRSHKQRHRQRLANKEGMYPSKRRSFACGGDDFGVKIHPGGDVEEMVKKIKSGGLEKEQDKDLVELEKEMWEKFYNSGFWRSSSRRGEDLDSSSSTQINFSIVSVSN